MLNKLKWRGKLKPPRNTNESTPTTPSNPSTQNQNDPFVTIVELNPQNQTTPGSNRPRPAENPDPRPSRDQGPIQLRSRPGISDNGNDWDTLVNRKKIRISGTGIEGGEVFVNEWAGFTVNTKNAGEGSLFVNIRDSAGGVVACQVEPTTPGHYQCMYKPKSKGVHTVFVTFRGVNLIGSPFKVEVKDVISPFPSASSTPSPQSSVSSASSRRGISPKEVKGQHNHFFSSSSSPEFETHSGLYRRPSMPSIALASSPVRSQAGDSTDDHYVSIYSLPEEDNTHIGAFDPQRLLASCALLKYISPTTKLGVLRCMPAVAELEIGKLIGDGHFGSVYQARCTKKQRGAKVIAVKTLTEPEVDHLTNEQVEEFLREPLIMSKFKHPNVMELLGITIHEGLPFIMMPLMVNGNLRAFLERNKEKKLREDFLLSFAHQVAKGMEYISNLKIIHRDLAARNCMLDEDLIVKISDFGLARDSLKEAYVMMSREKFLPIRWIAPEAEDTLQFDSATDMWAFGVVLWEIFAYGDWPYEGVPDNMVFRHILKGNRLPKPEAASDDIYAIMRRCWAGDPARRPTFHEMSKILNHLLDAYIYKSIVRKELPPNPFPHNNTVRFPSNE